MHSSCPKIEFTPYILITSLLQELIHHYAFLVVAPHVYTKLPLLINTKYTMSSITEHLNSLNLNF